MSDALSIVHITDIHIGETDAPRGKLYPRKNFLKVLQKVKEDPPDLIVIGGDLAADNGELDSYRWIKHHLDSLSIPYFVITGNHDLAENMIAVFGLETGPVPGKLYYKKQIKGQTLIFMDSASKEIDQNQLNQLVIDAGQTKEEITLFIHHPPTNCGCLFMDNTYPLLNSASVFAVLESIPNLKLIVCGHYHTEKIVLKSGKTILITPSTLLQFSQTDPNFKIDFNVESKIVGWRTITSYQNRQETRVHYL
jgi:3',5'-cyclic-AMP phosphodiesterase